MYKTSDQFLQVNNIIDMLSSFFNPVRNNFPYAYTPTPLRPFFRIIGAKERLEQDFQQVL